MNIADDKIRSDVDAIGRMDVVPSLLRVLCETTGMGFAAVARVTRTSWAACAVHDTIEFGIEAGDEVDVRLTICGEAVERRSTIVIEHLSVDPIYADHPMPRANPFESYVSSPIILGSGEAFGTLCAFDRRPASLSAPRIRSMFELFARLIALQLENDRRAQQAQAALLDERAVGELREEFIAVLGHDLRNPLSAVAACAELLQRKTTEPTLLGLADRMKSNVRRMSGLIDDVLDFARGRLGGGIGVEPDIVNDLGDALQAVATELRDANPTRRIEYRIDVAGSIRCDRARVLQVASNLIANALSHGSAEGAVTFTATVGGAELVLDVWNAAVEPIPSESIDKVFEPFWRRSTSKKREGLGLGLYICAQIVGAHGGRLQVSSTREDGTRFTARFPLDPLG